MQHHHKTKLARSGKIAVTFEPNMQGPGALWDKLRWLKPTAFLESFGFSKRCLISWYLPLKAKLKLDFFLQMPSDVPFHLEIVSTNVTEPTQSMWLSMWKRQFKHCIVKCVVNISRKNRVSRNTWKKAHIFEFPVVEDTKISDTFYNIQNVIGTSWPSIIITYLINLLSTGPF